MIIHNPQVILNKPIIADNGQLWIVSEVNILAIDTQPEYQFNFVTDIPVKTSPNQMYYHMTRSVTEKATLTLYRVQHESIFELLCGGAIEHGYVTDINTMDKFISRLSLMLPIV